MTELETNLTAGAGQASEKKTKLSLEIDQEIQSNCQGYLVDPITKLNFTFARLANIISGGMKLNLD